MFAFFKRIFGLPGQSPRQIFAFKVGHEVRYADPIQVDLRIEKAGGPEWWRVVDVVVKLRVPVSPLAAASLDAAAITDRKHKFQASVAELVRLAREAFQLPALDTATGKGVTDAEAIGVLTDYLAFAQKLAEDARPLASSPGR